MYGTRPPKRVIHHGCVRRIHRCVGRNAAALRTICRCACAVAFAATLQGEFGKGARVRVDAAPTGELLFEPVGVAEPVAA